MTSNVEHPATLLKNVVEARSKGSIEASGYFDALQVLEKHFWVYEQRLSVMTAPSSYPEGEVMIQAGHEGLQKFQSAIGRLKQLDPMQGGEEVAEAVTEAEDGISLLLQLRSVNESKLDEFQEALDVMESGEYESEY